MKGKIYKIWWENPGLIRAIYSADDSGSIKFTKLIISYFLCAPLHTFNLWSMTIYVTTYNQGLVNHKDQTYQWVDANLFFLSILYIAYEIRIFKEVLPSTWTIIVLQHKNSTVCQNSQHSLGRNTVGTMATSGRCDKMQYIGCRLWSKV